MMKTPYITPPRDIDDRELLNSKDDTSSAAADTAQHLPLTPRSPRTPPSRDTRRHQQSYPTTEAEQLQSRVQYSHPATISLKKPKPIKPTQPIKAMRSFAQSASDIPWTAMMSAFVRSLPSSDPHHPFKNIPLFDETTTKVRKLVEKKMILADKDADGNTTKVELFYLGLEDAQKYGRFLVYNLFDFIWVTPTKTHTADFKIWSRKFPHGSSTIHNKIWTYEIGISGQLRQTSTTNSLNEGKTATFSCLVQAKNKGEDPSWEDIVTALRNFFGIVYRAVPLQEGQHGFVRSRPPGPPKLQERDSRAPILRFPPHLPPAEFEKAAWDTRSATVDERVTGGKRQAEEHVETAPKRLQYHH